LQGEGKEGTRRGKKGGRKGRLFICLSFDTSFKVLVWASAANGFMPGPFDLISQRQLAALEISNHQVISRLLNQSLVYLIFEPFKVSDMG
jgi:hypothetical protein